MNITLKTGDELHLVRASVDDAEECLRMANQLIQETRFLTRTEEDPPQEAEGVKSFIAHLALWNREKSCAV